MNSRADIEHDVIELCRIVGLEVIEANAFEQNSPAMVYGPLDSVAILIEALMYPNKVIESEKV